MFWRRKSRSFAERYEIGASVPVQEDQILFADLATIEGFTFLVTISSPLGLWMISCVGEKGTKSLHKEFETIFTRYNSRGFKIRKLITDSEANFLSLSSMLEKNGIILDPAGPNKHVHKVEVSIRILKERVRSILHSLPYMLPRKLIPFLVLFAAARLNSQPCHTRVDPRNFSQPKSIHEVGLQNRFRRIMPNRERQRPEKQHGTESS